MTLRSRSWFIDFNRCSDKAQVRRATLSCDSSYFLRASISNLKIGHIYQLLFLYLDCMHLLLPCCLFFYFPFLLFLAHLSRRLTGELIVYPCSGVRRPSSVVVVRRRRSQFQRSSPLKPLGQSKPNFMWSILRKGELKFI